MVNINQNDKENEKIKISPLGIDEINSIIKSFKNSSFNQENLYKKDTKNFVKKSLFDLAKESEKEELEEKHSIKNSSEENSNFDESNNNTKEVKNETDYEDNSNNVDTKDNFDDNKDKNVVVDEEIEKDKENNKINEIDNKTLKDKDIVKAENTSSDNPNYEKTDCIDDDQKQKSLKDKKNDLDKIEYEEKTIEALDSVREAVTKSLEENTNLQNEEIEKNTDSSELVINEAISEVNYINALFKNIKDVSDQEIGNLVKSKVIELAEGVIGYQIEKFPEKFLKKIKNSIKEIKSINDEINIYLNDQDYKILNNFVESHNVAVNFKFDLDTSLGRGDFTIDMGGLVQSIKYKKVIE